MKSAFNIDNPFFALMGRLADYVILNLLFLLTACPVVTIGTALCAMHEVLPRMAEGTEGSLYRTYMQAFIRNFRCTVPVWLVLLVTGAVLVFDVTIAADSLGSMQKIVLPVVGSLLIFWLLIFSWVFLMQGSPSGGQDSGFEEKPGMNFAGGAAGGRRQAVSKKETAAGSDSRTQLGNIKVRDQMKAALFAAVTHLPQTFLMLVLEAFPVFCYLFLLHFFLGIILPFYVCIGFSLSAALCSILAGRTKVRSDRHGEQDSEEETG